MISAIPTSPAPTSQAHVHFGATPHRTSKSQSSCQSSLSPANESDDVLLKKQKSLSDLDKEVEARLAEAHREKAKKMGHGLRAWVEKFAVKKRGADGAK